MSNASSSFYATRGIDVSDTYAPSIDGCVVSGADTAYYMVTDPNTTPEAGTIVNCIADYCKIGIKFHMTTGWEPSLWIRNCDIRARDYGVWVKNRINFQITDNTFDQLSTSYALKDIQLDYGHLGVVLRNSFSSGLVGGRKNIVIDSDGQDLILGQNSYSGSTQDAVQVDASATDVYIY
jgi:hypothetical protein